MIVLGLHGGVTLGQHEPSAVLVVDGRVVAACEEERYLRVKSAHGRLPYHSIKACLEIATIAFEDIDLVVTPGITYPDFEERIRDYLRHCFGSCPRVERVHHQQAHIAAAFYGSGFDEAMCLSLDATGDGACGMVGRASLKDGVKVLDEMPTQNSLGFFYTLMTHYLGFEDGDEYKVMGLAPYGEPNIDLSRIIRPVDGGWVFDWSFVRAAPPVRSPFEPLYAAKVAELLRQPNRMPGSDLSGFYRDVARSTQTTMEDCLLHLLRGLKDRCPGVRNLCYSGGLALNCSANQRLREAGLFDNIYVAPVASDRGLALGCAYHGAVLLGDRPWQFWSPYLGSSYSNDTMRGELNANGCRYEEEDDPADVAAGMIAEGQIVGWYQGRSEIGARALGNRSIVARCDDQGMRERVNARIKYREEFRPFAPSILAERSADYFRTEGADYPYMCFTADSVPDKAAEVAAVVHVDGTARIQTVRSSDNELYYDLIKKYHDRTDSPVVLNTSFNLKGQPIVETPRDALMTFYGCGLDALIMGNFVVRK